ncbi:MAG TPA: hypothetical protein VG448_06500 [Solirubrobacterales bacterium]|nr:hypothetical protein [Solirubrobacterales bacterium]
MNGKIEEVRLVALSSDAHRTVCGLVQPSGALDTDQVFAADEVWGEVRAAFPLAEAAVGEDEVEPPEPGPETIKIMVLSDGETFSRLEGCRVFKVPAEWGTEEIEAALAEAGSS